ncbi:hypothetical protein [Engelhardtia mirabilis]|uniref:Uncharacterized protein n=1 Tax=Engelhardtia mirabilis TaxID=2528011 RepID=A0A518BGG0_9BACT|nr:hypothetical protein Pla133_11440 [Planctomycetes bacterium Pla133]QDV00405.1 hypothetical protein Pla86_11440 [Planctomycetes bacterium Pla86]
MSNRRNASLVQSSTARLLTAAAAVALLPAVADAAGKELVFDLSPFTPFAVAGEVWVVSSEVGEIVDARIDATLVVHETGPWSMGLTFDLPTGLDGFSSDLEGWSGPGTFTKSFHTSALNGLVTPPPGTPLWSWFLHWTGGSPFSLPGGGDGYGPLDGEFTDLRLTLFFADCPFGDPAAPWSDLGGAVPGSVGTPLLAGTGSLCPAEPGAVTLTGALPGAPAVMVVGTAELSLPLFGGLLVPTPQLLLPPATVDGSGAASTPFVWPAALAPGSELFVQAWVVDPASAFGVAASNGLRAVSP